MKEKRHIKKEMYQIEQKNFICVDLFIIYRVQDIVISQELKQKNGIYNEENVFSKLKGKYIMV